jgi:hypothetical protein
VADLAVLRSLAVGMLAQVRVAILRGYSERRALRCLAPSSRGVDV